jgi:hypothetical protein
MKLLRTHKKAIAALAAAVAAAAVIIGIVAAGGKPTPTAHRAPLPTPPPPVQPKTAVQLFSPFTGEPVNSLKPVIAVKIDNIVFARPQTGLAYADIVYVIPVEGGLSRFMAIFSSRVPRVIGPVRSAREDDINLLRQYGRPALAFSGAQHFLLPVVEHSRIVDLYSNKVGGYYRDNRRIAPYNLYAHGPALLAEAKAGHASIAHGIGFRFGPAPAGGVPTAGLSAGYSAASFRFTWSAGHHHWLVWMDGRPAMTTDTGQLSAATVVIQHTLVRTSPYMEWGALPPYAVSTGSGTALVLRDGKEYHAKWHREPVDHGTTFTTLSGQPMTFAPGQVWIVLG